MPLKSNDSKFESDSSHFFESVGIFELTKLIKFIAIYHYVAQISLD
jgi:hypothetical protein